MTTKNLIERVGLDIGFGDMKAAKIVNSKVQTTSFPSVLGQAQDLSAFGTGLGGVSRRRATRMVYGDVEYYIGLDALRHSRTQAGRQDRARIGSVEERVLALAALAKLNVSEAHLVSGLPVMWFGERKKLVKSLKGEHQFTWGKKQRSITIHKIVTTPQPFGGFYAHYLNDRGAAIYPEKEMLRTFGFLDIGWNTTDLTAIKGLQPVERWSRGERVGVRNIIETVGDVISRR